ncbi:MAG: 2-oxo-4-hydroxy-4-carboxy-5-ureidoimidazoline decarboxylase [Cyanobacteria bacterium P01_F01_bin.53]
MQYSTQRHSIKEISQMTQAEFVQCFGSVFEETPMVAQQAWLVRPFQDIADLHEKMVTVVHNMTFTEKLVLIRAHPELGARTQMADASVQEQASAGLDQLNTTDYHRIQALNAAYKETFDFPFVVAVKGLTVEDIIAAMEVKLGAEREKEITRSLSEIYKIARFRLVDLVKENAQL